MIPELGNVALVLALCLALVQAMLPVAAARGGNHDWVAAARPVATGQGLFVTLAFAILVASFATNDFTVSYVASNSNSTLPLRYRIAATWGGHEGSLLLWLQILALWTFAVVRFSRHLPPRTVALALGTLGWISAGFLGFILFTSNPFARLLPAPSDGRDLNPLLQDFGMIVHPPLLYMGYVGFSVAFAFAIAALAEGRLDTSWARWSRPWTLAAWAFLTLGIFMGSFWAYYELGWGGWWFWDAVENASFMPWLVGTALLHSLAVTEKRGALRSWTVLLAILAFSLSLLGTFLVRSGVLTSVHAFASDPRRGLYILVFLGIVVGGSLALYAWRAPQVAAAAPKAGFALSSRESALLLGNVLLSVAAGTVLLGTLYPLFLDALGLGKISVGPPYFETVFVPLMSPVLVLAGLGPRLAWKKSSMAKILPRLQWIAAGAASFAVAVAVAWRTSPIVALGLAIAAWLLGATADEAIRRLRQDRASLSLRRRIAAVPPAQWGMWCAHAGIGVFVVGVTLVKGMEVSHDAAMRIGDTLDAGGYRLAFAGLKKIEGPNYVAAQARFEVSRAGAPVTVLYPERRLYRAQKMPMTEAAIDRGWTRDVYVSLGEAAADGTWVVRAQVKPFVGWIWAGCLMIACGGFLAAADRRYRQARRASVRQAAHQPVHHATVPLEAATGA
jgi:cytochrome c-type biogenesis protein CcmF